MITTLWRLVNNPTGPNPDTSSLNRALEPDLEALLPRVGPTVDPNVCIQVVRALCVKVERTHPALADLGVPIPLDAVPTVFELIDLAETAIRAGDFGGGTKSIAAR